jgi:hypothetical protein
VYTGHDIQNAITECKCKKGNVIESSESRALQGLTHL